MNLLSQNEYIREFLLQAASCDYDEPVSCEDLGKELKIEVPDVFRRAKVVSNTGTKQTGKKRIIWSNVKYPFWARLFDWMGKKRCIMLCWDGLLNNTFCIHICVTRFEDWPGPGCIIHGSYD